MKTTQFSVKSPVFTHNGPIPLQYTCEGENGSPPIEIGALPPGTETLALIMEDPDAPNGIFTHWLLWNLSPAKQITAKISEGVAGVNSFGKPGYGGPCPPSGTHRYYFKIFALDTVLELEAGRDKDALLAAMEGHVLASGELMGLYSKQKVKSGL